MALNPVGDILRRADKALLEKLDVISESLAAG